MAEFGHDESSLLSSPAPGLVNALVAPAQTSAPDTAALQKLVTRVSDALNTKDTKMFGSCFTQDGEFTNPVGMQAKGRAQIEAFHAPMFSPTRTPHTPSFHQARFTVLGATFRLIRPDVASVDVRWKQEGALDPEGAPWGTRTGLLSWVAVREGDVWRIAVWHNQELPIH